MRNMIKYLGLALALGAWLQVSQPAMASPTNIRHYTLQSTSSATTVVTASTAYIASLVITVSTVGTNPIQVTNTAGDVKFQAASTALGTIITYNATKDTGVVLSGIKIVGPATAVIAVTITYYVD
jgi:hypothetical protein